MVREIGDQVWRIEGRGHGPTVAAVGGTHGNERTGIQVVYRLKEAFERGEYVLERGVLILAIGNPLAVERGSRGSDEHLDLNRCFTIAVLKNGQGDSYECNRARELAKHFRWVDYGIDLHATNMPSMPFIVMQRSTMRPVQCELVEMSGVAHGLTDPDGVFASEPVTLDEFFSGRSAGRGWGMCWETGHAEDMSYVDDTYARVLAMVSRLCMPQRKIHRISSSLPKMYVLVRAVPFTSLDFQWQNGFGTHNFQPVSVGDVIGHSSDVGGIVSDVDGVIVFPKVRSLWQVGKPVCYLAVRG